MPIDLVIDDRDGNKSDSEDFISSSGNDVDQVTAETNMAATLCFQIHIEGFT